MASKTASDGKEKFHQTIIKDIKQGGFKRTLKQEFDEIYDFYLDKETKERLSRMKKFRRWMHTTFHILKSMILKLTPFRRILLLLGVIITIRSSVNGDNTVYFGILVMFFVLMLELKDKLLAHDELATGRAVQFALMPESSPKIEGWDVWLFTRPANDVGGDLVDYLWIDDERLGLALGDVAGKGLGAALLMAKLQSTLRALAPNMKSLAELGNQTNTIFCRDGLPNRFVSLCYLIIQPNSDKVRLLNAGHFPPFHVRGKALEELRQGEPALGLMQKTTFKEDKIDIQSGDILFIYSDGLTEAQNEDGNFYGEKRVEKRLLEWRNQSSEEIGDRILRDVTQFIGSARPSDDLSLIILKRE